MENRTDANKDDLQKIKIQKLMYKIENKSTLNMYNKMGAWKWQTYNYFTNYFRDKDFRDYFRLLFVPKVQVLAKMSCFQHVLFYIKTTEKFQHCAVCRKILRGHLQSVFGVKFYCPEMV